MAIRMPTTVRLPFGFTIRVRRVSVPEMKVAAECEPDDPVPDGLWDVDDMTVYVLRALPIRRQRYVLCHELHHAVADLTHQQLNDGVGKP